MFAGKRDQSRLCFPEKALVAAFGAKEGGFRDRGEIAAWAAGFAVALRPHS